MGRGKLMFKGEEKAKKRSSKVQQQAEQSATSSSLSPPSQPPLHASVASTTSTAPPPPAAAASIEPPQIRQGTGSITTSGTVVTGHDTLFPKELSVGDALIVSVGQQQSEMRVITMLLSNTSLNLSTAFSQSVSTPTQFQYIRKPRDRAKDAKMAQQKAVQNAKDEEAQAFGTYGTNEELVYREKTEHGSYRIKKMKLDGKGSRTELLEMRTKKKSDKYC